MDRFCKANAAQAEYIERAVKAADTIGIVGHVRPDGDDVGSCLGLARYIGSVNPKADVRVFLEEFPDNFMFLAGADQVIHDFDTDFVPQLCFMLDCADEKRMGGAAKYFLTAGERICIDHHATNDGSIDAHMIVEPKRSSTCELLCTLIDMNGLDQAAAECLYLGIVHDTGVFKHSNTGFETMLYAGKLIELGARPHFVIDYTFYKKTYPQNRALGQVLLNSSLMADGRIIVSSFTNEEMRQYGVKPSDLDGCIDQLRVTEGVEAAAFIYQMPDGAFKVSLRSNGTVDVSRVAQLFGGGGHVKASGCEMEGTPEEIAQILCAEIVKQIR
ncbi:MAG: bifunctional oligoribonuclease/PAP phosphatase NrnA [Lachnospiraceae bacterium]|nr:bifunctional oligoribonuclease/PAP phosphatase NrnA [Lachnospiraceae bacterium]